MKKTGFTMIELMVVLSIMAILLSIAPSSFTTFVRGSAMSTNSNELVGALNYARMEAVKRGNSVQLGQRDALEGWTSGIVVWVDADDDNTLDTGEELRLWEAHSTGSTLISAQSSFTFSATGEVNNTDTFTLCDNRTAETGRTITLLSSGASFSEDVICG